MIKQDLSHLSKEQLEDVIIFMYDQMDKKANSNKEMADKFKPAKSSPYITPKYINAPEDPGYMIMSNVLRTMCNLMKVKVWKLSGLDAKSTLAKLKEDFYNNPLSGYTPDDMEK